MQDKFDSKKARISTALDNCYIDYVKISNAPKNTKELVEKYGNFWPDFRAVKPEHRADTQEKLDKVIERCRAEERKARYKATDGLNVYLIANPLIWPDGPKGVKRLKPKILGPLEKTRTKRPFNPEPFSYDFDE